MKTPNQDKPSAADEAKAQALKQALDKQDWDRLVVLAVELQADGMWDASEYYLNQVLKHAPKHLPALKAMAAFRIQMGRAIACVELLESARAIYPDDPELLMALGRAFAACARIEDALAAYDLVESTTPKPLARVAGMQFLLNLVYLPEATAHDRLD